MGKPKPVLVCDVATREVQVLRACRECGCTDIHACPGGCSWVEADLCSGCATQLLRTG